MKVGQKIKKLRELKNFSQEYLANELGITQSGYSKMENGNVDIPFTKLEEIAAVLGFSIEDIISFNEKMIFNIKNNKRANGVVINQMSGNERKVYDEYIETLKNDIAYLKTMVDKLLGKK